MPRYAVGPDDLGDAAAVTAGDGPALELVHRLVATAATEARAALDAGAPALSAAVDGYGHVEGAVAAALAEAVGVLSGGLAAAAHGYAQTDSDVRMALSTPVPGGGR
jgi:hypothetical protein